MSKTRYALLPQIMLCLLFAILSFSTTADAAGILAKAREKQGNASETAAGFLVKLDALVKASVTAEVSGDIVTQRGDNSNYATLTVPSALVLNRESWDAEAPNIVKGLEEISNESLTISFPFSAGPYNTEFISEFDNKLPREDKFGRILVFRGLTGGGNRSEWEQYNIPIEIYREIQKLFGDGYNLSMTVIDNNGATLKSANRTGIAMPAFMVSRNLFLAPFFCESSGTPFELSEQIYAGAAGAATPIIVQFQSIIETELLDRGDDIVFSAQRK